VKDVKLRIRRYFGCLQVIADIVDNLSHRGNLSMKMVNSVTSHVDCTSRFCSCNCFLMQYAIYGVSAGVFTVLFVVFIKQVRAPVSEILTGVNNFHFRVQYVHFFQQQTFIGHVGVYKVNCNVCGISRAILNTSCHS